MEFVESEESVAQRLTIIQTAISLWFSSKFKEIQENAWSIVNNKSGYLNSPNCESAWYLEYLSKILV